MGMRIADPRAERQAASNVTSLRTHLLPSLESDDGYDEVCKRLARALLGKCHQGFH